MKIFEKIWSIPLIAKVLLAIVLGMCIGWVSPLWVVRIFETISAIFSNFLGFIVPLIILGLVAPGIADLGQRAGRMLLVTVALAYGFTMMSGFLTYFSCEWSFPLLLSASDQVTLGAQKATEAVTPYFTVNIPPLMSIMTALVAAFTLGLGISVIKGGAIKNLLEEFRQIITKVIENIIIPLLPLYILGIFAKMTYEGQVVGVLSVFVKVIAVIFVMTVLLLLLQFVIAGVVARRNPLKLLKNMVPAYLTALGTQSSAATIPVTLNCTVKNGVNPDVAGFTVPLCATIHLSGSTMKITACAMAIMMISGQGASVDLATFGPFIAMLGITMVAAPGVPGGAIMAALGLLESMLGFGEEAIALMIALYIAMDSFGTATNVTGDGAITSIIDRLAKFKRSAATTIILLVAAIVPVSCIVQKTPTEKLVPLLDKTYDHIRLYATLEDMLSYQTEATRYAICNEQGVLLTPPKYYYETIYHNGLPTTYTYQFFDNRLRVRTPNAKYGYSDRQGREVIPTQYKSATLFNQKYAVVADSLASYIIDTTGRRSLPCEKIVTVEDFQLDQAPKIYAARRTGKWGYVDPLGNVVIPCIYDTVVPFFAGAAAVCYEGKYAVIDTLGRMVTPTIYDEISSFDITELGFCTLSNDEYKNEIMVNLLGGYFAFVKQNNRWGAINTQGEIIAPIVFKFKMLAYYI